MAQPFRYFYYKNIPDTTLYTCTNGTEDWCYGAKTAIGNGSHDYFLLLLDDYWVQSVDRDIYFLATQMMEDNHDIAKIDLSGDRARFPIADDGKYFVESAQDAPYRTSLQAAFWRKDYFMQICPNHGTAWDFEISGSRKAMNDGARIFGVKKPCLKYINVMRRGEWYGKYDF